ARPRLRHAASRTRLGTARRKPQSIRIPALHSIPLALLVCNRITAAQRLADSHHRTHRQPPANPTRYFQRLASAAQRNRLIHLEWPSPVSFLPAWSPVWIPPPHR